MNMIYLGNIPLVAIPVCKIDWVRWDESTRIIQVMAGNFCHQECFDIPADGINFYRSINEKIEDYYK